MPTGQGQPGYGFPAGQPPRQGMPPGPAKSTSGPPMRQQVPMFGTQQNGSVTPPSSLNPMSNVPGHGHPPTQQPMNQVKYSGSGRAQYKDMVLL